ncbi:hypothetical protein FXF52_19265 [Micromonospora sp. MP36]|nr:hypothetical protein FXF52_19265 [Micromonospora sp. MP36]
MPTSSRPTACCVSATRDETRHSPAPADQADPSPPRHDRPLIRDLGVPTLPGRLAALRQLVLQAPTPIVAQILFGAADRRAPTPP